MFCKPFFDNCTEIPNFFIQYFFFRLEENFMKHLKPGQTTLTLNEFKKMMPSKNEFFVRRVYEIFDIDGDGQLSLAEFLDKMYQYADSSNEINKVLLLFQVYDIDGMHK